MKIWLLPILLIITVSISTGHAQDTLGFWHPSPTYDKGRMNKLVGGIGISYTAATIGLSQVWYSDSDQSSFHFFNDWNEWNNMDKYGHFLTAYHYARIGVTAFTWAGLEKEKAIWVGIGAGNLLQLTIEVLDGFSTKWGFSVSDLGFNIAGTFFNAGQEWLWDEQRIVIKLSTTPHSYSDRLITSDSGRGSTTLRARTDDLLGASFTESWLKDYNQQTIWASFNIYSFINKPDSRFPKWLNIAVGYGAQNMYGGFENTWEVDGERYTLGERYDRYGQYYLSLDIDLSRIKTKSAFINTVLSTINFIKIPAPALEWNSSEDFNFHFLHY